MPRPIDPQREALAALLQLNERLGRLLQTLEHSAALTPQQVAHVTGECAEDCPSCSLGTPPAGGAGTR